MPYYFNREGERLWFEEAGSGVPLVLVHGWCMSSAVWKYQLESLQNSFRVIAIDLRGHGYSREVSGPLDFKGFAADLSDLLCSLDLTGVVLVGWSMGAQVALQAYQEISARLSGLTLVSATPCFTATPDFPYGLARNEAAGMRIKIGRNAHRALEGFHARMFVEGEFENQEAADQILSLLDSIEPPDTNASLAALESLATADMRALLPGITTPALILNGDLDRICMPQASKYLADNIGSAQQMVFKRTGPAPFLSRAAEFNSRIVSFAESVCPGNV
ncbi:MAG: alpha/beta fold hydrolase [Deltaproteobacteria bacterium]|nr:alpha/beta fold hydrolase [Deltaproteobacteria bacterium]